MFFIRTGLCYDQAIYQFVHRQTEDDEIRGIGAGICRQRISITSQFLSGIFTCRSCHLQYTIIESRLFQKHESHSTGRICNQCACSINKFASLMLNFNCVWIITCEIPYVIHCARKALAESILDFIIFTINRYASINSLHHVVIIPDDIIWQASIDIQRSIDRLGITGYMTINYCLSVWNLEGCLIHVVCIISYIHIIIIKAVEGVQYRLWNHGISIYTS